MSTKENKFNVNDIVMFKNNLILVKIIKIKNNEYGVVYPHLKDPQEFWVDEDKLEEKPYNYDEKIFKAYIEYKYKYEELCNRLYSPSKRERY